MKGKGTQGAKLKAAVYCIVVVAILIDIAKKGYEVGVWLKDII